MNELLSWEVLDEGSAGRLQYVASRHAEHFTCHWQSIIVIFQVVTIDIPISESPYKFSNAICSRLDLGPKGGDLAFKQICV